MSGHSKWSQIKRQKGVADAKKGQVFTKLGNAITIAVGQGGANPDPESNFKLRLVIEKAKQANMPKENIQRAIDKAQGKIPGAELQEVLYEGFGPHNIAVIIEAVTDNHLRTQAEVKNYFGRYGGRIGGSGSVSYLFKKSGVVTVLKVNKSSEEILMLALETGAEDIEEAGEEVDIYTKPEVVHKIKKALDEKGLTITEWEIIYKPTSLVQIANIESQQKITDFLNGLKELDDVQKVYSNYEEN